MGINEKLIALENILISGKSEPGTILVSMPFRATMCNSVGIASYPNPIVTRCQQLRNPCIPLVRQVLAHLLASCSPLIFDFHSC